MFHFASPQIYFPLQIGSVGGKGSTLVSLLILSPDKIKLTGAIKDKDVILVGNRTVTIEVPAIEAIHPTLADFFKKNGCEKVLARYFLISGETAGFAGDFCATVSD